MSFITILESLGADLEAAASADLAKILAAAPSLEGFLTELVQATGVQNISWPALIQVLLTALPGGPMAMILAVLSNLNSIFPAVASHAAAARVSAKYLAAAA